jgi:hypothetical protein
MLPGEDDWSRAVFAACRSPITNHYLLLTTLHPPLTWRLATPRIAATGMAAGAGWELRHGIPSGDCSSLLRP